MTNLTSESDKFIRALLEELEVPEENYKRAERSYKSFGDWVHRDDSQIVDFAPEVYVQGSFRLGTAIKPSSADGEYDIDLVCVLQKIQKSLVTQEDLKSLVGGEVSSYREAKAIKKPVKQGQRCWTLEYADGAHFHMDILPALPNGESQRLLLEARGLGTSFADTAIAITDRDDDFYQTISDDWPRSNPKGYAEWFRSRMTDVFEKLRKELAEAETRKGVQASIEDIPEYRVRTPLQQSIMILKRHRDDMFLDDKLKRKPISIIISTLAAHAYEGESNIGDALLGILSRMQDHIKHNGDEYVIANPSDLTENFADKWKKHPDRETAFFSWLNQAKDDFFALAKLANLQEMAKPTTTHLDSELTDRALQRVVRSSGASLLGAAAVAPVAASSTHAFSDEPRMPSTPRDFA